MKKYLLAALAVFSFTFANAQGFKFGVKGGGNYSNLSGKDVSDDSDYKFGYHLGVVALYEIDDMIGIKPELLYSTKGFQFNTGEGAAEIDQKLNLNYFTLPILLNVNAGGLFFEIGPEIAYQAAVISEYKQGGVKIESPLKKGAYSQFDIGYAAGLGYMSDMGLMIGLRYNGGLKSIYDTKNVPNEFETDARNSVFQVSVGYMFGL